MTMQADLLSRLLGATGAGQRVSWVDRPQLSSLPAITLQTINEGRAQRLSGFEELQESTVQLDVWGDSYGAVQAASDAAIAAVVPAVTAGGTAFARTFISRLGDFAEPTDTKTIFRKSMDLVLHHSPA